MKKIKIKGKEEKELRVFLLAFKLYSIIWIGFMISAVIINVWVWRDWGVWSLLGMTPSYLLIIAGMVDKIYKLIKIIKKQNVED